jgi:C1A family cysteine protease
LKKTNTIIVSPVDPRDHLYTITESQSLPLKYIAPRTPIRCQWFSSQCVAYACTQALSQYYKVNKKQLKLFSPGSLYANREENDYQGEGWYIRKALKQLKNYGVCLLIDFLFPESYKKERKKFLAQKDRLLTLCSDYKIKSYFRCNSVDEIKSCILQYGSVIVSTTFTSKCFLKYKLTKKDYTQDGVGHAFILIGWDKTGWIAQDSYSIFRPFFGKFHLAYDFPIEEFWGIEL